MSIGLALTTVWSKAPPPTARCLSPLPGFESQPGHVRNLPVTWGYAVVFAEYSGFLHYLQLASHKLATIGINVTKNKIPSSKCPYLKSKPSMYLSVYIMEVGTRRTTLCTSTWWTSTRMTCHTGACSTSRDSIYIYIYISVYIMEVGMRRTTLCTSTWWTSTRMTCLTGACSTWRDSIYINIFFSLHNGGWNEEDHFVYQYVVDQYPHDMPHRRMLYLERLYIYKYIFQFA